MKPTLLLLTLLSFSLFAYSSPDLPLSNYTEVEIAVLNTFAPDTPSMIQVPCQIISVEVMCSYSAIIQGTDDCI